MAANNRYSSSFLNPETYSEGSINHRFSAILYRTGTAGRVVVLNGTDKNKYHDMLKDNRKSPAEICYYIESKYNVVDVSNDDSVILKYKAIFIENCLNSICNA